MNKNIDREELIKLYKDYGLYDFIDGYKSQTIQYRDLFEETGYSLLYLLTLINNYYKEDINDDIAMVPKIIKGILPCLLTPETNLIFYGQLIFTLRKNGIFTKKNPKDPKLTKKGLNFLFSLIKTLQVQDLMLHTIFLRECENNYGRNAKYIGIFWSILDTYRYYNYSSEYLIEQTNYILEQDSIE